MRILQPAFTLYFCLAVAGASVWAATSVQEKTVRVGEDGIRKSAARKVLPKYPSSSIKNNNQGVGVCEVEFDGRGLVTDVRVLEAPDSATRAALESALRQWTFRPSSLADGTPVKIRGKITFYFVIDPSRKGQVRNPKQYQ